jgi:alpha-beta hydrolase superfamily lysophospholipase
MAFEDCTTTWMEMDDGVQLYLHRWKTPSAPKAVLHIVHGMAEHSHRYSRLAERLVSEGIEVWAADQRGHGETTKNARNDPGKGGRLGHCGDGDGFARVTLDIDILNKAIRKEYPKLPIFLFGHSWGSFVAQNYIENYDGHADGMSDSLASGENSPIHAGLAGCILSGTRGPDGLKITLGSAFLTFYAFIVGERRPSSIARALADGPYTKAFRPIRTNFDWLSRDEREVDAYANDIFCGKHCSLGFYRDMGRALKRIHKTEEMAKIRKELSVYIFSGSADPAGEMGKSPSALAVAYKHLGIRDLETVLYPDARHETLNETNRDEVQESLLSWLLRHCV